MLMEWFHFRVNVIDGLKRKLNEQKGNSRETVTFYQRGNIYSHLGCGFRDIISGLKIFLNCLMAFEMLVGGLLEDGALKS